MHTDDYLHLSKASFLQGSIGCIHHGVEHVVIVQFSLCIVSPRIRLEERIIDVNIVGIALVGEERVSVDVEWRLDLREELQERFHVLQNVFPESSC